MHTSQKRMPGTGAGHSTVSGGCAPYFFGCSAGAAGAAGAAGGATVYIFSILASARSLVTRSACALRVTYCSICGFTSSKDGAGFLRLSSTLMTCQPNCVCTGSEIWPLSSLKATSANSGTFCFFVLFLWLLLVVLFVGSFVVL